jgi:hypothetical protein
MTCLDSMPPAIRTICGLKLACILSQQHAHISWTSSYREVEHDKLGAHYQMDTLMQRRGAMTDSAVLYLGAVVAFIRMVVLVVAIPTLALGRCVTVRPFCVAMRPFGGTTRTSWVAMRPLGACSRLLGVLVSVLFHVPSMGVSMVVVVVVLPLSVRWRL